MKKLIVISLLISVFHQSQMTKNDKLLTLTAQEYQDLKTYLTSKNIVVKDTILIKYDYNRESCWNNLDERNDGYIKDVLKNFQNHIINFNKNHSGAVAVNFREPGKNINKLKLWDNTIMIDESFFLKNLIFSKKKICGNSAIVMNDGSYVIRSSDPHFNLLDAVKK